jgi:uncharacterized protein
VSEESFHHDAGRRTGLNYLCAGYKAFFEHVDRPMRIMADLPASGRYADEVVGILAAESRHAVTPA